jgi:hypothetical protein
MVKITMCLLYQENHPRLEDKATMINQFNPPLFMDNAIVVTYMLFDCLLRIQVVVVLDEEVDKMTTNRLIHKPTLSTRTRRQ